MTTSSTADLAEADYLAIEAALQSSDKGKRFLRAYIDRNRSLESLRLLRSISRLHRATLGAPGLNAEISRDLTSMLKSVSRHRRLASECDSDTAMAELYASGLEEVEACLITLIESIEERAFEVIHSGRPASRPTNVSEFHLADRTEKLIGELSSFFAAEPR
jgi:hypothetical protein